MPLRLAIFLLLFSSCLYAQNPVGLILEASGASVRRVSNALSIAAPTGDLLYEGDELSAGTGHLAVQHCGSSERLTYVPGSVLTVGARGMQIRSGALQQRTSIAICTLPDLASNVEPRFYGPAFTRGEVLLPRATALSPAQDRAISPVTQALAVDPGNPSLLVAKGALLERFGLHHEAAESYGQLQSLWTSVDWPRKLVHRVREKERQQGEPQIAANQPGKTFALVVGISDYPKLQADEQLRFAHRDALTFASYLRSQKGGALPDDQLRVLLNEKATTAAIRNGIAAFLRERARKQDTVILFLATHGVVDEDGYILTHDSDPEDLRSTALPMREIQSLLLEEFAHVGRVLVYVDACRAGTIGAITRQTDIHRILEVMLRMDSPEILGILASGRGEVSFESDRFGGGHGAFSYFLLRGLNGDADEDRDGIVESGELIKYVRDRVREATLRAQNPKEQGNMPDDARLVSDIRVSGIELAEWKPLDPAIARKRTRGLTQGRPAFADTTIADPLLEERNRLRVTLQNKGQQIILRYLRGEAEPQRKEDFVLGERYFREALQLDPDALALESRALFCQGRALLFDKRFEEGIRLLERAALLDGPGAYSWNALGIAYLEKAEYARAAEAFRDAIQRAPFWAYPRHNLALALTEQGDTNGALLAYKQAIDVAPLTAYLHYNQGLLLSRQNQNRDAESALKRAIQLAPASPDPSNALGFLYATRGKRKQAEALYRIAIGKDQKSPLARHNLALLLSADRKRAAEATALWEENTRTAPDFLASRISLASAWADAGRVSDAIHQLEMVISANSELVSARLALANLFQRAGRMDESIAPLRHVLQHSPNPGAWEQLGDALRQIQNLDEARKAYQESLRMSTDHRTRRRIEGKLRGL